MVSFVNESTIHGVSYIFGPNRNIFTRIFWACLFSLSIFSAVYLIRGAHKKWLMEPLIVVSRNIKRPIEEFPKFAVTVCPGIIQNESLTHDALKERFKNEKPFVKGNITILSDSEECFEIRLNSMWCEDFRMNFLSPIYKDDRSCTWSFGSRDYTEIVSALFKNYQDSYEEIVYGGIPLIKALRENDKDFMNHAVKAKKTLTGFGVCSTFNLYSKSIFREVDEIYGLTNKEDPDIEWSPDSGYFSSSAKHPERMKIEELPGTKKKIAGVILLKDLHFKSACNQFDGKLKIIIHQPNEVPTQLQESIEVKHGTNVALKIKIKNEKAYQSYRKVSQDIRQCYFEDEKKLEIFRSYSKYKCKIGCESRPDRYCYILEKARSNLKPQDRTKVFCFTTKDETWYYDAKGCSPACNNMTYKIINAEPLNPKEIFDNELHKISNIIVIEYDSDKVEETENYISYTISGFIAEFGGYLGLFLGCSILSLIEIAFFGVVKLINILRRLLGKQSQKSVNVQDAIAELKAMKDQILMLKEQNLLIKEMTQSKSEEKIPLIDDEKMVVEDIE